jgi:hypothetical protein
VHVGIEQVCLHCTVTSIVLSLRDTPISVQNALSASAVYPLLRRPLIVGIRGSSQPRTKFWYNRCNINYTSAAERKVSTTDVHEARASVICMNLLDIVHARLKQPHILAVSR